MRQYRGRTKDGEWIYGWYMEHPFKNDPSKPLPVIVQDERPYEVLSETVGQFTGRNDEGDKRIWEGDICTAEYRCPVCFDTDPHLLTGTIEQGDNGLWMFEYAHGSLPLDCEDLQNILKIGNRHEHPELLQETDHDI